MSPAERPAERLAVGLARSLNKRWPGMAEAPDQHVLAMFGAEILPLAEVLHDVIRDEVAQQVAERGTELRRAWNQGYSARREGQQQSSNPYPAAALASPAPAGQHLTDAEAGCASCPHGRDRHAHDYAHGEAYCVADGCPCMNYRSASGQGAALASPAPAPHAEDPDGA